MKRGTKWEDAVTPVPEPDDEGPQRPLAEAISMVNCVGEELDEAREHLDLADSVLAELRALLDSGELKD